ncbi:MAG: hypothetical protein AAF725_01035 [Acidobacteriota bacterium]
MNALREALSAARSGRLSRTRLLIAWAMVGATLWAAAAAALEALQLADFWWVDPFTHQHAALWMPVSAPAKELSALAQRLSGCLPRDGAIAVEITGTSEVNAFYWSLWLASELPEHDLQPAGRGVESAPARYRLRVSLDGGLTAPQSAGPQPEVLSLADPPPAGLAPCASHPARLEALAAVSRESP